MSQQKNISLPLHNHKRAIVVGASSGIGAALVNKLAQENYTVAALARREEQLTAVCQEIPSAIPYVHDVTDYNAIPDLFGKITQDIGGLDMIIYVAGIQPPVATDEYNTQKDKAMIETNLIGAIAWLNLAAARFERAQQGQIVGISSIAGDRGRVGSPVYNASKASLNTYLEALRNRLSKKGVTVTTIKPGFVDTVLLENAPKTFWVISPDKAAAAIFAAVQKKRQIAYVPARWAMVGLIVRHIPSFVFRRLSF
ncbi:MAG: short-chain dehydrogenase [Chloroflexi bacterium]|nr:MAG: short-chain dehydrogenase [Chloroflexota bacterium]